MSRKSPVLAILALAVIGLSAIAIAADDPVWIRVNGQPILKSQVVKEMERLERQLSPQTTPQEFQQMERMIKRDAMQRAVQAEVLRQEADTANITVTDAEVEEELKKLKVQFPSQQDYQSRLNELKLTETELRDELRSSLRYQRLLKQRITVPEPTEDEIKKVYERAKERLREPAKAEAYCVLLTVRPEAPPGEYRARRELANTLLKQIRAGRDIKAVAAEYSDAGKGNDGREIFIKGQQTSELENVLFTMKPGQLSGVIETPVGFYIIKMIKITPERTPSLEEVRPEIIKFLTENEEREKMQAYVEELVKKAGVEYLEPLPDLP